MRILIVDDEESIRNTTLVLLESMGHEAMAVRSGAAAIKELDRAHYDVAFLDLKLDGESGLDVLPKLLESAPRLDIVVFTAFSSIETAVEAMRRGAADYIPKPFTPEQIRKVLGKIVQTRRLKGRLAELESRLSADVPRPNLETAEPAMQQLFQQAFKAATTPATILMLGESGTGKSVLARAIHEHSTRRENDFVTVSCPSLSRELLQSELFGHVKGAFTGATAETWGKVAMADGGTLFLDEIGELPLEIQPKLLRLLQEREYERVGEAKTRGANVRVIASTNRNLEQAVKDGRFREDLYYRLNVISLVLPPIRERRRDLMNMATDYLKFFAAQCGKKMDGFAPRAEQAIKDYGWPGNLRELRNVIERAVILSNGEIIEVGDLPEKLNQSAQQTSPRDIQVGAKVSLEQLEYEHIRMIIAQSSTMEQAAQTLGIDPATLYRKRKRMEVQNNPPVMTAAPPMAREMAEPVA